MGLVQPYLVLQLMVPGGARLAVDLSVVDSSGSRRRIQMSTSQREIAVTPLNARVPLATITGEVSSHTPYSSYYGSRYLLHVYSLRALFSKSHCRRPRICFVAIYLESGFIPSG